MSRRRANLQLVEFDEFCKDQKQEESHQPEPAQAVKAHDADQPAEEGRKHYFSPNQFYCVETLCAPCGVVVAWTKFDKSESPTKILN